MIAIEAIDIQGSSKRIVDSTDLNNDGGIYRLEKAPRIG